MLTNEVLIKRPQKITFFHWRWMLFIGTVDDCNTLTTHIHTYIQHFIYIFSYMLCFIWFYFFNVAQCFAMTMLWMDCLCDDYICFTKKNSTINNKKWFLFYNIFYRIYPHCSNLFYHNRWKCKNITLSKKKKLFSKSTNKNCFLNVIHQNIVFNNLVKSLCTQSLTQTIQTHENHWISSLHFLFKHISNSQKNVKII